MNFVNLKLEKCTRIIIFILFCYKIFNWLILIFDSLFVELKKNQISLKMLHISLINIIVYNTLSTKFYDI